MESALTDLNQLSVIWRRKWIVLVTMLVVVVATELVSRSLTPIYETSATLVISQPGRSLTFDAVQADEEAARSYAQILSSPNFAGQVASLLGNGTTQSSILSRVSIQAVANTELITITADDPSPTTAKRIADTYASVFVNYAPRLAPQTNSGVTVALATNAPLPTSPARPKPTLYAIVAAFLGLMAGIALAFLRERSDKRLRSVEDLAAHTGLPILANVPARANARSTAALGESFRLLRTTLGFVEKTTGPFKSIAVTSWTGGEGKTTVAYQLALALTETGTHTVIVDGDAHRPALQALFELETSNGRGPTLPGQFASAFGRRLQPGLSDYVGGKVAFEDCVYGTTYPTLRYMPAGGEVPSLSSLIDAPRGRAAFAEIREREDKMTIIDCPPLASGADAAAIAGQVDGVILVVDLTHATSTAVSRAVRRLDAVNAVVLGIVVNRDLDHMALAYYDENKKQSPRPRDRRFAIGHSESSRKIR